ncbi:MAG: hypothetical protein GY797_13645 [Deltaproteobacteria bacterium]|nr:hypothetical protein [Deltaproteobacteria bacterium]
MFNKDISNKTETFTTALEEQVVLIIHLKLTLIRLDFFHVFFESRDLKPKMIPATISPTLTKANPVTIKRESSLAEGSAMALRINSIKPIIINIEGK